jgi:flagellar motor switch protein FliG
MASTAVTPETRVINPLRKAAIFLIALGDQASAGIMRHLSEEEMRAVSLEIAQLETVPADHTRIVLEEFNQLATGGDFFAQGGTAYANRLLVNALGQEPAQKLLGEVKKSSAKERGGVRALKTADPLQLASVVREEHPQTIALILASLSPKAAATLLMSLPPLKRKEAAIRVANLDRVSPEVLSRISSVIEDKLKSIGQIVRQPCGGVTSLAGIINEIDGDEANELLASIGESDPNLKENVQRSMFVFEDIMKIDQQGMRVLLAKADRKILLVALKGTTTELRDHFGKSMSQRGAEIMKEDMEALGAVRIKDVQAAQQQVIELIRQLEGDNQLSLGSSGESQYVA